jgi:hypothetical protein
MLILCSFVVRASLNTCVVDAGVLSFDLAEIGSISALNFTSREADSFVYTFSACGDVPPRSAGAACLSAPSSAVLQEAGGPCYGLGTFASRKARATLRGVDIDFTGGDSCGGNVGVLRSTKLIVECADEPMPIVLRAGHGTTQCSYEVLIHSRAGCALQCKRDASGAICGGSAHGICSVESTNGPAHCECATGWTGVSCGDQDSTYTKTGHQVSAHNITGHKDGDVFLLSTVIVIGVLIHIFRHRVSLVLFAFSTVMLMSCFISFGSQPVALGLTPNVVPISTQSHLHKNCLHPDTLLVIYSNRERWESHPLKSFIVMIETLKSRYGWLEYVPRARKPREDAASMEANMLRDFGRAPDVLLFFHYNVYEMKVVDKKRYPRKLLNATKYMSMFDDLPRNPGLTFFSAGDAEWFSLVDADLLLPTYEYLMVRAQAIMHVPRIWMPHSALPVFEMPFNVAPRRIILLVGFIDFADYPMRAAIQQRIKDGDSRFERFNDPGLLPGPSFTHVSSFAAALHANLAAIFCASRHHYTVSKVMEVPATGALLLFTDDVSDALKALGFLDGVHWISYNASSLDTIVDWVLDPRNRERVDTIRAAGQALAHARHSTAARVDAIHKAAIELARTERKEGGPNITSIAPFPNYADWTWKDPRSAEYYAGRGV